MRARFGLKHLFMVAIVLCASREPAAAIDVKRADVKEFIAHMADTSSFKKRQLRKLLKAAQSQPAIIEAMDRPAEKAKQWFEYRPIFVSERRIREGTDFWIAHRQALDRASVRSGVAPEYLAAILGVETYYGRLTKGSYAGAMGAPQFMPSNYRRYAVDADADGHIDLWTNWPDVCASVGNYLKEHGWNTGEPVLSEATVAPDKAPDLDGRKLALSETVGSLRTKGVNFDSSLPEDAPALLIAADDTDGIHWRVGYNNFYVITRYNHSALYAMAVYELAAAVKQRVLLNDSAGGVTPAVAAQDVAAQGVATPGATMPGATTPGATTPGAAAQGASTVQPALQR